MNIIDDKGLLPNDWELLIRKVASAFFVSPFCLKDLCCFEDIHKSLNVDIVISDKTVNYIMLQESKKKEMQSLEITSAIEKPSRLSQESVDYIKEMRQIRINEINKRNVPAMEILGEYKPQDHNIYLYIETIQAKSNNPAILENYILTTYIHEMLHAYFDRERIYPYIFEIEEGLAEGGTLLYLDSIQSKCLAWAVNNIQNKKIAEYSKGAKLYTSWKYQNTDRFDLPTTIREYRNIKVNYCKIDDMRPVASIFATSSMRDEFEKWLVMERGLARSTAVQKACVLPIQHNFIKTLLNYAKTDDLYLVSSKSVLDTIKNNFPSYQPRIPRSSKQDDIPRNNYISVIDCYIQFLSRTNRLYP